MENISLIEVFEYAKQHNVAIPAINVSNMETIAGLLEVASDINHPIILQVAPLQTNAHGITYKQFVNMVKVFAQDKKGKYCTHLDHCESIDECKLAIEAGFNSVMYDGSKLSYEENIINTKKVVDIATEYNCHVEGELGSIKGSEGDECINESIYTDPNKAEEFVQRTGISCLAISIGNVHGHYRGDNHINLELLKEINSHTEIPLVLHGGTGLEEDIIKEAIKNGIRKINFFTEIDESFMRGFTTYVNSQEKAYMMFACDSGKKEMKKSITEKFNLCMQ